MRHALAALFPGVAVAAMACASSPHEQKSPEVSARALSLGTTQRFAVLAGSTVTNTGPTVVMGDLGVSPGSAVMGFPPGLVNAGSMQVANAVAAQAQSDATIAYNTLAGQACDHDLTGQDLAGMTLTAGTYCFASSAQLTGTLTLNAQGNPAAAFVFQVGSALTTSSNSSVVMTNGGDFCNVYWQVGSSATIGTGTKFMGNIIALTSITLTTGVSLFGRAVARNAAVTMDTNMISAASCQAAPSDAGAGASGDLGRDAGPGHDAGTGHDAGVGHDAGAGHDAGVGHDAGAGHDAGPGHDAACTDDVQDAAVVADGGHDAALAADAGSDAGADAGATFCNSICTDLQTNPSHCGSCDHACGPSEACVSGICCSGNR